MSRFLSLDELAHMPEPRWLIDGLFEQDALVMLVGPPGSFKSFLAIDWALCLASGRGWNERAVKPSNVLYALGEGKASLLKRIQAWQFYKDLSFGETSLLKENFHVTFDVPQLAQPKDTERFIHDIQNENLSPTVLVIDTLARSYVGKNENDPMDAGVWVQSVDRLRQAGMTVIVLHHTKKNTEFGLQYRGTTAFLGAMDTAYKLERSPEGFRGFAKLSCDKQKDHIEPPDVWMRWEQIRPKKDVEGSIVLIETEKPGVEEEMQREAESQALQSMIDSLLDDKNFTSDRARARELAKRANMLETSAQTKIHRARKNQGQLVLEFDAGQ